MTGEAPTRRSTIGVVVIGRNEGQRLRRCLESVLTQVAAVVYVDSGSSDDSVRMARSLGVEVIELDLAVPFTAARARNAGICRMKEIESEVKFVQVVDGDCEIADGWLDHALEVMQSNPDAAVVCGRRRERERQASVYNTLCDMEWNTPIGEAAACGGDALIRLDAYYAVGGFKCALIAGEEPEMCFRLRREGWRILRIDRDMTLHDAEMTRFGQWWTRAVRCGHAYAEGRAMHGDTPERYRVDEMRSIVEWAMLLPLLALGLAWLTWGASLLLLGAYALLWHRVRRQRVESGDGREDAALYARYCVLSKFAQLIGAARYWWNRLRGRASALIEYKSANAESAADEEPGAGSDRMPILYVGGTLPARSETFVYREVLALRDLGVDVRVATVHPPQRDLGDDRVDALADEVIEIYGPGPWKLMADALLEWVAHPVRTMAVTALGMRDAVFGFGVSLRRRPKVLWQCVAGLALARRARGLDIEHIHVHMAHVPTTIAMYCARQLGVSFSFTGHAVDLFRECTLLKAKLRRASFTASISEWHQAFYRDLAAMEEGRLPIVRCGVDVDTFAPVAKTRGDGVLRMLAVGRLVEKKGFDVLIRAVAALGENALPVECTLVGDGREREGLESLVHALEIEDRVRLIGEKENGEVRRLMRVSDLFVLPCRIDPSGDRDGIPVVLMEAMACGVCAISGDLPAIRELITDRQSGLLVDRGSVEALAAAVRELIGDPELRRRLAEAGRQRVIEEFSLGVNVQRLLAAFSQVVMRGAREGDSGYVRAGNHGGATEAVVSEAVAERSLSGSGDRR